MMPQATFVGAFPGQNTFFLNNISEKLAFVTVIDKQLPLLTVYTVVDPLRHKLWILL